MPASSSEEESNQLFEESISYLKRSLLLSAKTQQRVGLRVRILIRGVMIGLVVTLLSIFYLIYLLTNQVNSLSDSLDRITTEAVAMRNSVDNIQIVLMSFETQMDVMPALNYSVEKISGDVVTISDGMNGITHNISKVSTELTDLHGAMRGLSGKVTGLDQTLFRVERDMNSSSKPFRRFNQMNPMNHLP
ncbi:MAG TPA: hypothetical protein EYH06_02830 [Chromatiales bacterium]|nr:hypothetical protein [Thiotrichales bacterium]HIP67505.1 hypothetical protein [Chromatiales bacterium]